jgi:membrane associated rhomboid family serine protease
MKQTAESFRSILILLLVLWGVFFADLLLPWNLASFGIYPRTLSGLIGIPLHPFLHGSMGHLISNSIPLVVLTWLLFAAYGKRTYGLMTGFVLLGGLLVWVFGRSAFHIGASGLIYAEAAFLVAMGIMARRFLDLLVALLVIFLYGGMVWGVLPVNPYVSWEGHLMGVVAGVFIAIQMRKGAPAQKRRRV